MIYFFLSVLSKLLSVCMYLAILVENSLHYLHIVSSSLLMLSYFLTLFHPLIDLLYCKVVLHYSSLLLLLLLLLSLTELLRAIRTGKWKKVGALIFVFRSGRMAVTFVVTHANVSWERRAGLSCHMTIHPGCHLISCHLISTLPYRTYYLLHTLIYTSES